MIANPSSTGQWRFVPANRTYPNAQTNQINQDYSAILLGEVTGNWNPAIPRPAPIVIGKDGEQHAVPVTTSIDGSVTSGANFSVDLRAFNSTRETIFGYQFEVAYDEDVILPSKLNACDITGTVSSGQSVACNTAEKGIVRVVVFGASPIGDEAGTLMRLNFTAVGKVGTTSPVSFENFMFNEGLPGVVEGSRQVVIADLGKIRQ